MLILKNPKIAVPVVLFAGLIWSFGPLVVRYMDNPQLIPWQYIFGRGLTIFILLNLYLYFEEGKDFYKNYFKIGISGLVGRIRAWCRYDFFYVFYHKYISAAITLLCLAAMPFFTALLAFIFLKEKISLNVWISIIIASVGIGIMAIGNTWRNFINWICFWYYFICRFFSLFSIIKMAKRNSKIYYNSFCRFVSVLFLLQ